jgi:hypothetical protein
MKVLYPLGKHLLDPSAVCVDGLLQAGLNLVAVVVQVALGAADE